MKSILSFLVVFVLVVFSFAREQGVDPTAREQGVDPQSREQGVDPLVREKGVDPR